MRHLRHNFILCLFHFSNLSRLQIFVLSAAIFIFVFDSQARLYRSITFATNDTITPIPYDGGHWQFLTESDAVYGITYHYNMVGNTNGESTNVQLPTLSNTHIQSPPYAMHFLAKPLTTGKTPGEKMFINVCNGADEAFAVDDGETSAEKFWVYIPNRTNPGGGLLNEWWNGNLDVGIRLVDGSNAWCPTIQTVSGSKNYTTNSLTPGWHKFVIQVTLAFTAPTGRLTIWVDNAPYASPTFDISGVLTGQPGSVPCYVEAGLYRGGQNRTSEIWMDDIRYGDSFADVNPDTGPGLPNTNGPSANETWYGSGTDNTFTNVENWSGTSPDSVGNNVFFGGQGRTEPTNNMPDDFYTFNGITFNNFTDASGGPRFSFNVTGNRIRMAGGITNLCTAFPEAIQNALSLQTNLFIRVVSSGILTNAGVISGDYGINLTSSGTSAGKLVLTGQNSFTGPTTISLGTIEVSAIGNAGDAGPLGAAPDGVGVNAPIQTANGSYKKTLRYVGGGETNNRSLYISALNVGANNAVILDASGTGPLVMNGSTNILAAVGQPTGNAQLILRGTSTADNTLAGDVRESNANALGLVKADSGTWLLEGSKYFRGGMMVAGGTLKFDSIAPVGTACALGSAITLCEVGTQTAVNYAIGLTNGGVLQYVGVTNNSSDRNIGVSGDGTISDGTAGGSLFLCGVITNLNTNGNTLTLSGSGNSVILGNIVDSCGGFRILKTGGGKWTLSGTNSYSGNTVVNSGTLDVSSVQNAIGDLTVEGGASMGVLVSGTSQLMTPKLTLGNGIGATLEFNGVNDSTTAPLVVSNLVLNGHNTINIVGGSFMADTIYPLISFSQMNGLGDVCLGDKPAAINASIVTNGATIALQVTTVASAAPPGFPASGISSFGGNVMLSVTGILGTSYTLWTATNLGLLLPGSNFWKKVTSGNITTNPFLITNIGAMTNPQQFYIISSP